MPTFSNRLSFIGNRIINFNKSDVNVSIIPRAFEWNFVKFGQLPFSKTIQVSGKLGQFDISLVDGLTCQITEGLSSLESKIILYLDNEKYQNINKYQRAFLKSMHGTTNSILMRYIEGVAEVNAFFTYLLIFFKGTPSRYSINRSRIQSFFR